MNVIKQWLMYLLFAAPGLWYSFHYDLWVRDIVIVSIVCFFVVNFASYTLIHAWKTFHRVRSETAPRTEGYVNVAIFVTAALAATASVLFFEPKMWGYLMVYTIGVSLLRRALGS